MNIQTIEQSLQEMGETLTRASMMQRAREIVEAGGGLEVIIKVSPSKQGAVVSMHSIIKSQKKSHGSLIKLK